MEPVAAVSLPIMPLSTDVMHQDTPASQNKPRRSTVTLGIIYFSGDFFLVRLKVPDLKICDLQFFLVLFEVPWKLCVLGRVEFLTAVPAVVIRGKKLCHHHVFCH